MKKHNFNPGPSILPAFTVENTVKAIMDLNGSGLGLMEVSHRGKDFQAIIDETVALFKELLGIPEGYSVIFLGGGASLQFAMVPYNMLEKKAGYLVTGEWAKKAHKEAKFFGETVVVASSEDKNFNYIPRGFNVPKDLDYLHVTTNNTIFGTELFEDYNFGVPLVADMSSDILSRPIDVSKYVLIYGGAQKNLGPAGVTFIIAKNDAVGNVTRPIPTMLQYKLHIEKGSLYNTPPVVPIYACLQTLKWLKNIGGVNGIEKLNIRKSDMLYNEIDTNPLFKATIADKRDRSRMNICWVMKDEYKPLEQAFQDFATSRGMVGIKGHRSVGGFRASFYNALPIESAQALIDTMREFAKQNG